MDLISRAQNQEDIMLWRALRHVRDGFYIDVGAADPVDLSVTKVFYDRGWHGINLEPSLTYSEALRKARPRDINLCIGANREAGERTFYHVNGTGLSTFHRQIAMGCRDRGWEVKEEVVKCLTLAEICRRHRPYGPIHFLKIDAEGAEGDVLAGADFETFRPWILLVEATVPLSREPAYANWEPLLTGHDYTFVWFDGLNRYYVAAEHQRELHEYFLVQPNVFDDFVSMPQLMGRVEQAQNEATRLAAEARRHAEQIEERSAEAIRRTTMTIHQTAAALAQQTALTVEMHRQSNELIRQLSDERARYDDLLSDERARYDALLSEHKQTHGALENGRNAAQRAEEALAQLRLSTSWRLTAPLRTVRRLLPGVPDSLVGRSQGKEFARRVFHGGARLIMRLPGGRRAGRLIYAISPAPVDWLARRYRAYEQSAAERRSARAADSDSPSPADLIQHPMPSLSEEEGRAYRQFSTGTFAPEVQFDRVLQ